MQVTTMGCIGLDVRIHFGVLEHRAEIRSAVGNVSVGAGRSLLNLATQVAVHHRHVIADLIADRGNLARHQTLQILDFLLAPSGSVVARHCRVVPVEQRVVIAVADVAVHPNVVPAQRLDVLSNDALEFPLNRSAVGVSIDLKWKQMWLLKKSN